jgi:hypothetical protein
LPFVFAPWAAPNQAGAGDSVYGDFPMGPGTLLTNPAGAFGGDRAPLDAAPAGTSSFLPSPSMDRTMQAAKTMQTMGLVTSVLGGIGSAIGSFYAARAAQYQEKAQASSFAFQSDMAAINSSRAEMTAESIQEAGKNQIAGYTMQAGQQKAGATATMAARGIALGVGSAADVSASMDIEKSLNVLAIDSNATRQAWAAREQGACLKRWAAAAA